MSELPNEILMGIYGTGGLEKTASPFGDGQMTLSDLALMLVVDEEDEGQDLTKVASAHDGVLDQLVSFDRAGRAMAHHEFSEMEKAAFEGNTAPLEEFFADAVEEPETEVGQLKQAVLAELNRRLG